LRFLDTIQENSIEASNELTNSVLHIKNSEKKRQSLYNPNNPYNSGKNAILHKNTESQEIEKKIGNPFEDSQSLQAFGSNSGNIEGDLKPGSVRTDLLGVDLLRAKRKIDLLEQRVYDIENSQKKSLEFAGVAKFEVLVSFFFGLWE
jgi:hypothetical protein